MTVYYLMIGIVLHNECMAPSCEGLAAILIQSIVVDKSCKNLKLPKTDDG